MNDFIMVMEMTWIFKTIIVNHDKGTKLYIKGYSTIIKDDTYSYIERNWSSNIEEGIWRYMITVKIRHDSISEHKSSIGLETKSNECINIEKIR